MNEAIFKNLNPEQVAAVKATEGKVRVVAGAGSGKTRVLTNRYAYLVECLGIDPSNILCMTFTNKAAQEMRTRIGKMIDLGSVNDYICTIHGLCVKILRKEIYRLGYPKDFMIADEDDCKMLMKQVMVEQGIDRKQITVNQLLANVGCEKAHTDYVPFLLPNYQWPSDSNKSSFLRFLQLQNKYYALDFNDLINFTLYIFSSYPDVLECWQKKFDYVQVDEVQDCSGSDWAIIDAITAKSGNLFIVGDPDQAIYEWRGAKPNRFVQFEADTDVILHENYRSTPNIIDVANSVIRNNKNRVEKSMKANMPADAIAIYKHAKNETEEGEWISSLIDDMIKRGMKPEDFAILYRSSYLSRFIEQALMNKHLPYTIWGGIRFFERKEIKDCIAYLRLIQGKDDISFKRIVNVPSRKFGKVKMETLENLSKMENRTLFDTLKAHLNECPFDYEEIKNFVEMIEHWSNDASKLSISDLLQRVLVESGLGVMYRTDEDADRIENIKELMDSIRLYEQINANDEVSLVNYLQDIALFTNSDYNKDASKIKLMTIHQSKGLEFPFVVIIGLTEGIFPSYRSIRERGYSGLEEERRLMYVALTRAEKALFLTESEGYSFAIKGSKYPSRFISEIQEDLIKAEGEVDPFLISCRDGMIDTLNVETGITKPVFMEGDIVTHEVFGDGVILSINLERKSCEVDFNGKTRNILWKVLEIKQ